MNNIEQRITRLERQNRALRWALAAGLCLGVVGVLVGASSRDPAPKVIEAQSFNLVDAKGKLRATLFVEEHGPRLWFKDLAGQTRASVGFNDDIGPFWGLLDSAQKPRIVAEISAKEGRIELNDLEGKTRVGAYQSADGGLVAVGDRSAESGAAIGSNKGNSFVAVGGEKDAYNAALSSSKTSAGLDVTENHHRRLAVTATNETDAIVFVDKKEKQRLELALDDESSRLVFRNPDDQPRLLVTSESDGSGLFIYEGDKTVVRACDSEKGATIRVDARKGSACARVSARNEGSSVDLCGADGKHRVALDADDGQGSLFLRNAGDDWFVRLVATKDGGAALLTDAQGKPIWSMPAMDQKDDAGFKLFGPAPRKSEPEKKDDEPHFKLR